MSTFRNPVGPQPSRVYWRRRLVLLLALVAIIAVVVFVFARLSAGGGEPSGASPTASDEPAASDPPAEDPADPTPEPTTAPVEGGECDPSAVRIEALTDTNSYASGQLPQLSFKVTNTSGTTCVFNLGSTQQSFVVTSGEEPYWSSKDCEVDPVDAPVLLEPNLAQSSNPIPWDRTRSSPDTCATERTPVPAGGATYNLTVTVGAAEPSTISFLLN